MSDCIILAGGFGTRLKTVVSDKPKPLAEVNGLPFLDLLLHRLSSEKRVSKVVLAVGYMGAMIIERYRSHRFAFQVEFSVEERPLGTGGALKKALQMTDSNSVLALNGDSYIDFDFPLFADFHNQQGADLTLLCRKMDDASRYGAVVLDEKTDRLLTFEEKNGDRKAGLINAGVYWVRRNLFDGFAFGDTFSFEKEALPKLLKKRVFGYPCQGLFIDIGTPDSFREAQILLKPFTSVEI